MPAVCCGSPAFVIYLPFTSAIDLPARPRVNVVGIFAPVLPPKATVLVTPEGGGGRGGGGN